MFAVLASFAATIGIICALEVSRPAIRTFCFGKPWPKKRELVSDLVKSLAISVVIVIAISLGLKWTGFVDSQFYRPSSTNYGHHEELELTPEDVYFNSKDGTRLHGWFLPAEGDAVGTVIHFHGSDGNITDTIDNSYWLPAHGFNVFTFDYRGYGQSAGEPTRLGLLEDGVAAIGFIRSRPRVDADRICLWGQSLGGQLAIVAADRAGPNGIRSVVAEATYSCYSHQTKDKVAQLGPLWLVQWGAWLVTSDDYSADDVVGNLTPTRLLLVHGTADKGVQPYHSERLFNAAMEPKYIWRVEGAQHLNVFAVDSYKNRLVDFFRESLQAN